MPAWIGSFDRKMGKLKESQDWQEIYECDTMCGTIRNSVERKTQAREGGGQYGNDLEQLDAAFSEARQTKGQPTAIIMKTVKGKGVSFMENQAGWHGKAPNAEEYAQAMAELEKAGE